MLGSVFRFEIAYQLRGAAFLAIFGLFFLVVFGAITVDQIQIGSSDAVNINAPHAVAETTSIMAIFGMFIPVVFMATGATRDRALNTHEVFGALPVGRRKVLIGRFFGGLLAAVLAFGAVPLGIMAGSVMPWLDQEQVGPFNAGAILYHYALFGALNMLILGSILFTVANLTRSMIATWIALVALIIAWGFAIAQASNIEIRTLIALIEPFGIGAFSETTRYWTAAEKNTQVPELTGILLQNRLLWGGGALALFALNLLAPSGLSGLNIAKLRGRKDQSPATAAIRKVELPILAPSPLGSASWLQFRRRVWFETSGILRSVAFWVVLALSVIIVLLAMINLSNLYGTESYPVTRLMIGAIEGGFTFVPLVIAVYYTAELVWRERSHGFHEIVDATPTPSWAIVSAKFIAVLVLLVLMSAFAATTAIIVQAARGYADFELSQYAIRLFFYFVVNFGLLTVLALFLQVLLGNRWAGIGAILAYFIVSIVMVNVGLDHILYNYGGGINLTYSDMNGYGSSLGISAWLTLYWVAFAVILSVVTYALWSRGQLDGFLDRIRKVPSRIGSGSASLLVVATLVTATTGSWVFYNTNVRNTYMNGNMIRDRAEAFEAKYRGYEFSPQPDVIGVDLDVDLYPERRQAMGTVIYTITNPYDAPLEEFHFDYAYGTEAVTHEAEGASLRTADLEFNHFIFDFDAPLLPGEERLVTATFEIANPGFKNSGNGSSIRNNGTFFNSGALPRFDWGSGKILTDRAERRKRDLPIDPRAPKLEDERYWRTGPFGGSSWIDFKARVTTSADQIAVAPGYLISEETNGDRRTFVYEQDVPIQNFYAIQSARYEVAEDVWNAPEGQDDVNLQIFYDAKHPYNIEVMMEAMKLSLDKFTDVFTPFQYRQLRIQEFPYASFAQSFPNTVPYSENIGFIVKLDDDDDIDPVTYITAHEVAHQWFGHQLSAAGVQGSTMLIESFAQYGAFLVMEDLYGKEHMRRFLRWELDRYLSGRAGEGIEELPLYSVENQPYIHYQKGGLVMYLLRDLLGEDVVNGSLKRMIKTWQYANDPYPRSVDFLEILRDKARPEHDELITDLFEKITLYDVNVTDAAIEERSDGRFDVTISFEAAKFYADGAGEETETVLALPVDIGIFAEHPKDVRSGHDHIIFFERREITSGSQTISVTVDKRPTHVGVDPYNKLIDRRPENNVMTVNEPDQEAAEAS